MDPDSRQRLNRQCRAVDRRSPHKRLSLHVQCTYPCDRLLPRGECCVRRARISRVVARTTTAPGKKTSEQLGRVSKEAVDKLQWILVSLATSSTLALLSASSSSTSHFTEDCGTLRAKINTTGGDDWISIINKDKTTHTKSKCS